MLIIEYPKCSTCKNACKYLDNKKIDYSKRDIVLDRLNKDELDKLIKKSKLDINKFFNTSGIKFRELNLKDKIVNMTYNEKLDLLASDGMLVKRPILETEDNVLLGFKVSEWDKLI